MKRLLTIMLGVVCLVSLEGAAAQTCTREDFAKAVNGAGVALRQLNAENAPRLQAKMRQLKTQREDQPSLGGEIVDLRFTNTCFTKAGVHMP